MCFDEIGSPSALYDCTNPDWAPTQNMGHDNIAPESVGNAMSKYKRAKEREANKKQAASKKRKTSCSATSSTAAASEVFSASASFVDARGNTSAEGLRNNVHLIKLLYFNTYIFECFSFVSAEAIEIEDVDVDPQTKGCQTDNCLVVDRSCQTDMTLADFDPQHGYIQSITTELHDWKKTALQLQISQNGFKDNDQKTKFYLGLPSYLMLIHVFNLLTPKISTTPMNALCQFQEFLLVLMRLKPNLPFQDLAYRFGGLASTATRIFYQWVPIMSERLDFLIKWPDRENLRKTMPLVFKQNFGNKVAVIIDCFEVFIDRPSSLIARAMTWSNYKHHNTVKFLIGITPQGVISFISKAWGGRVSDKYLTENSGILKNLLPGDIVLADRGFDIADSVGFHGARLYIPAFTRGKKQLSALEVE